MITAIPGQIRHKRAYQINQAVSDDHIVVQNDKRCYQDCAHSDTFE